MSHNNLFYTRLPHYCDYTMEPPSGKLLEILTTEFSLFAGVVASDPWQHTVRGIWIHEVGSQEIEAAYTSSSNLIIIYFSYQLCIWKTLRRSVLLYYLSEWRFEPTWYNIFMFPSSFMMMESSLFKESELFFFLLRMMELPFCLSISIKG
jgi:hypothetical protein